MRFWLHKIENATVISIFFKTHIHLNSLKLNTHQNFKKKARVGVWFSGRSLAYLVCFGEKKEGRGIEGKSLGFLFSNMI